MARRRKLTPEQASGILDMHARGMGAKRIAKAAGLTRSLIRRVLARWKPKPQAALPGGSPRLALPVVKAREIRKIPPAAEIGAPIGRCPLCRRRSRLSPGWECVPSACGLS
jgi:hypothetical protein